MHTGTDGRFVRLGHPGCQLSAPAVKLQTAHDTEQIDSTDHHICLMQPLKDSGTHFTAIHSAKNYFFYRSVKFDLRTHFK